MKCVSYKTVGIVVSLVCIASIGAMEQESKKNLVTSQEIKDLAQSIMIATGGDSNSSLKGSRGGWFSNFSFSDWWYGLDTNVASELKEGTLTKDAVAQDKELQNRAYAAVNTALENKRTENLCVLLNQLHKFEMLACIAEQKETVTQFLNTQIPLVCEQKSAPKLMNILTTMQNMHLVVDDALVVTINEVLNEQRERDTQVFKKAYQETQDQVVNILKYWEKGKERYKDSLIEAKDIVLMQKYLAGKEGNVKSQQIKEELGLINDEKSLTALLKALESFAHKK